MSNARNLTNKSGASGSGLPLTPQTLKLNPNSGLNLKKAKAETFKLTSGIKAHGGGNAPTSRRPKV